ncbi:MAG TPA: hypothetical protein VGH87_31095 [Polyangiaceae bacterium]
MRRVVFAIAFFAAGVANATPTRDECLKASEDAQLLRIKTQLVAARDKLVVCSNDACPKLVKKDCRDWLDEVDHAMPTIVLGARDPDGKDLVDVHVTLDGNPIVERLEGKAIAVDPGSHTLRFDAGGQSREQSIIVREGEKSRVVSVVLGEPKPVQPITTPLVQPPLVTVIAPSRPVSRAPSAATWVFGGLGLATLAASGIVGAFSLVRRQNLYDSCGAAGQCAPSDVDQVYAMYDLAYAGAAIGGAFLLTGVVLFFTTRPSSRVTANASGIRLAF